MKITKEQIAEIAKRRGVKIITCCFCAATKGATSYSKSGLRASLAAHEEQFAHQAYYMDKEVGDHTVVGPMLDDWCGDKDLYILDGVMRLADGIVKTCKKMGLVANAEILNKYESSIKDPHLVIPWVVKSMDSTLLRTHMDIIHISSYTTMEEVLTYLEEHAANIGVVELGMPGRRRMRDNPEFFKIAPQLFQMLRTGSLRNARVGVEQFDYNSVIDPFNLRHIYDSTDPGIRVLEDDTVFLEQHGML